MLKPQLVVDVPHDRKALKDAQRLQYNKSSHQLAPIAPGSSIRIKLPNQDSWTLEECTKKLAKRSYVVLVNGQMYRRNRRALRVVNECPPLPDHDTPMPLHSREAATILPPVDDNVPLNGDLITVNIIHENRGGGGGMWDGGREGGRGRRGGRDDCYTYSNRYVQ